MNAKLEYIMKKCRFDEMWDLLSDQNEDAVIELKDQLENALTIASCTVDRMELYKTSNMPEYDVTRHINSKTAKRMFGRKLQIVNQYLSAEVEEL